jgi:hypothetical protein
MPVITCENCGARYSYKEQTLQMRDKDSEKCVVCHHTLLAWNGGVNYYDFQLISLNNAASRENEPEVEED